MPAAGSDAKAYLFYFYFFLLFEQSGCNIIETIVMSMVRSIDEDFFAWAVSSGELVIR